MLRSSVLAASLTVGLLGGALTHVEVAFADGVTEAQARVDATLDELETLRDQLGEIDEEYGATLDRKSELDAEIAQSQAEVDRMSAELGGAEAVLQEIAVQRFMAGGTTDLSPVFSNAKAYSAAEQRDALGRMALDSGEANVDDIEALLSDLQDARDRLDTQQSEAADLIAFLEAKQNEFAELEQAYLSKYQQAKSDLGEAKLEAEQERREAARPPRSPSGSTGGRTGSGGGSGSGSGGGSVYVPPVSGKAGIAVQAALSQLGVPYRFAAESPGEAFDCSGLTKWAWGQAGIYLPHQSGAQYRSTAHVPVSQAQPGDLIFYYTPIGHVGLYIGGGQMVHAPQTGDTVSITQVRWYKVVGVGRPG